MSNKEFGHVGAMADVIVNRMRQDKYSQNWFDMQEILIGCYVDSDVQGSFHGWMTTTYLLLRVAEARGDVVSEKRAFGDGRVPRKLPRRRPWCGVGWNTYWRLTEDSARPE